MALMQPAVARLGLTLKKIFHASERDREDVALLRWHYEHDGADVSGRLLFFAESVVNLAMARAYGRGPKGERVLGSVPKNWATASPARHV